MLHVTIMHLVGTQAFLGQPFNTFMITRSSAIAETA